MARTASDTPQPARIGTAIARFFGFRGANTLPAERRSESQPMDGTRNDWGDWGTEPASLQYLIGAGSRLARNRQMIYTKWQAMLSDPIISSAMRLHVTAALGGHESKGQMVFIEPAADFKGKADSEKLVEELAKDLGPLFDRMAPSICFNAVTFGDAYGRIYSEPKVGVRDVYTDELIGPPLVQPFERGNTTVGYVVTTGTRFSERLTVLQVARMKMPRLLFMPQDRVIEKSARVSLRTDLIDDLPAVPAMAGGSFLDGAEIAYDKFSAAWAGLVGQRVQASINESLITVQQQGMTKEQSTRLKASLTRMFEAMNTYIQKVVDDGVPIFKRIYHFIPTQSDKQMVAVQSTGSAGQTAPFSTDDVMMHARFLAGALGVDLSMIGFADQMSGGLGDGGFFQVSAQSAERSRAVRTALTEFFDHIIRVHLLQKHGLSFDGMAVPWQVNYFSGISALESARQKTKAEAMNSTALFVQTLAQLRDLGLEADAIEHLMVNEMQLDAKDAKLYAKALKAAKPPEDPNGGGFGGAPGGGGMPFGGGGEEEDPPPEPPVPPAKKPPIAATEDA